jgi:hypothetical protein
VSGSNHSRFRPKLYERLGLWQGTINIQLSAETYKAILIPTKRVPGCDEFDFDEHQDFLVRPCKLKGTLGYQILPIDKKTSAPRGLHAANTIEIALTAKIDLKAGEELHVELQGFED